MMWNLIYKIDGFFNFNVVDWIDALELGFIIYFPFENVLRIIPTNNLRDSYEGKTSGENSFYYIADNTLFISSGGQLKKMDFNLTNEEVVCTTKEERIRVMNKAYSIGTTNSRKSRINRNVIIRNVDCSEVYAWDDRSYLIGTVRYDLFLFQAFEDDRLKCIDIDKNKVLWKKSFNKRIGPSRFYKITEQGIIVQDNAINDVPNLACLDKNLGTTLWEIENSLSFYNYNEANKKLYGLNGKTFEVINTDNGVREIQKVARANLHIASHLTYYSNGVLYFSGFQENSIPVFGAVDVENGELIFTQEVEMPGEKSFRKGLDRPIVIGNRLYIRDSMKTLHIYEKETGS